MPHIVTPIRNEEPAPNRKRWTRKECKFLVENGLLAGRYELVEGEIISKMGQNVPHSYVMRLLVRWLVAVFGSDFMQSQLPIDVAEQEHDSNQPEPDGAALSASVETYADRTPGPADLLLVVEVSDTTLRYDLRTKADLYARAGIGEYWVIDVNGRQIVVHREPTAGHYTSVLAYGETESVAPLSRPSFPVLVADLLPPTPFSTP